MAQASCNNLVLIGMPGCGKTTIANELKEKLCIPCLDTDAIIEYTQKKSISELFKLGENYFRNIEEKVVFDASLLSGVIISTGGGVIKRYNNIVNLKKNGVIFFINRPLSKILEDIDVDNRPLLKDKKESIIKLYNERIDLYKGYADIEIINDSSIEEVLSRIINLYKGCDL
ncbi:shikimate kinase [Clostridium oryzae]|uniref:Shikimate kinase n=1 Tax=Clostridium oryzae TaxID=1450648 RepID=A0A1V4IC13_9CLOT|nr:shikimate kinase [Clostridium oryzae]OPJ57394.1 shikimate kinase 1 [Clostridium oryzae]